MKKSAEDRVMGVEVDVGILCVATEHCRRPLSDTAHVHGDAPLRNRAAVVGRICCGVQDMIFQCSHPGGTAVGNEVDGMEQAFVRACTMPATKTRARKDRHIFLCTYIEALPELGRGGGMPSDPLD